MHVLRYNHMMRDVAFGLGLGDTRALPHAMIIDPRMGLGPRVNRTTTWEPGIVDRILPYPTYFYLVDVQWILLVVIIFYAFLFFFLVQTDAKERRKRIHAPLMKRLDLPDIFGKAEDADNLPHEEPKSREVPESKTLYKVKPYPHAGKTGRLLLADTIQEKLVYARPPWAGYGTYGGEENWEEEEKKEGGDKEMYSDEENSEWEKGGEEEREGSGRRGRTKGDAGGALN